MIMRTSLNAIWISVGACLLALGCSTATHSPSFDTSYSAPADWKLVEDGKWGLRFNIPPSLRDVGFVNNSLWVHEGTNLRVIVDFSLPPNYSETRLRINGLPALVCSDDQNTGEGPASLSRVVALFFLETRPGLGSPNEPSYRIEFADEGQRTTALQILQTVRFYQS
ncbi:MAG: hypothetical protein WAM70_14195 [Pyrinomonadaceae bacterium]